MAVRIISDIICKQNQNYLPCINSMGEMSIWHVKDQQVNNRVILQHPYL